MPTSHFGGFKMKSSAIFEWRSLRDGDATLELFKPLSMVFFDLLVSDSWGPGLCTDVSRTDTWTHRWRHPPNVAPFCSDWETAAEAFPLPYTRNYPAVFEPPVLGKNDWGGLITHWQRNPIDVVKYIEFTQVLQTNAYVYIGYRKRAAWV
jgi:hypothetical protein